MEDTAEKKEDVKKPDMVWWHIQSKDGQYLSRARFGTKESALQEMLEAPKTYPPKLHRAVRVEYRFTETADAPARGEPPREAAEDEEAGD